MIRSRRNRNCWIDATLLGLLLFTFSVPALAQEKDKDKSKPAATESDEATEADAAADEPFLKGSTETHIQTLDGVYLNLRLWVPEKVQTPKETPIVVLMHMRGRSQRDWFPFAKFLCDKGFAVCTFDFRGHGQSRDVNPDVYMKVGDAMRHAVARNAAGIDRPLVPRGEREIQLEIQELSGAGKPTTEKIDQSEEFRNGKELAFALPNDLSAVKEYLLTKHNEGVLNIRRLGIVGAELGAAIAIEWMNREEFPIGRHQGFEPLDGDVAAAVLISPSMSIAGYRLVADFNQQGQSIPMMIISGNDGKVADDAERMARKLRVPNRQLVKQEDDKKSNKPRSKDRQGSGFFKVESKLVGSELLRPPVEKLDQYIGGFLKDNLTKDKSRNWQKRELVPERTGFGSG